MFASMPVRSLARRPLSTLTFVLLFTLFAGCPSPQQSSVSNENSSTEKTTDEVADTETALSSDETKEAEVAPSEPVGGDGSQHSSNEKESGPSDHEAGSNEHASDSDDHSGEGAHKYTNRLAGETSLYLRMHAHNPINWYPWGDEAFEKAKKENKLVFLSVGYSSCYWCHVMERESFMDEEIAKFMNDNYVCIKVDREERPDLDAIYMLSVQIRTQGRGGWPMSVFLTPDSKPFFGGTYFPARDGDRPPSRGFLSIAKMVLSVWKEKPEDVQKDANGISDLVAKILKSTVIPVEPTPEFAETTKQALASQFDSRFGGFGYTEENPQQPKFPEPSNLMFLTDLARKTKDEQALNMMTTTLERMHMGGIWDHIGGGFHRYSVDRFWQIPHFEKMLYDNGQLLSVYAEAYALTKRSDFRQVVEQTAAYLDRELRNEGGGYFAAMDAESEKVEGKFYRWKPEEVKETIGDDFELFAEVYGLDGEPNFEHEFYVPQLKETLVQIAEAKEMSFTDLDAKLQPLRDKLLSEREKRVRPLTDNKIITSWNGLAIRGLADAGRILENPKFTDSAIAAAEFVLKHLRSEDGRMLRTYTDGKAALNGYIDDYAFTIDGLIALHKATGNDRWLTIATELMDKQIELFWDEEGKGFFFTSKDHEKLIARTKAYTDTVQPAGNTVSVENLIYLAKATERADFELKARVTIGNAAALIKESPSLATRMSIWLMP